jgi:hypothetical protein
MQASISIDPPGLIAGKLSPRVLGLVIEWTTLRHDALMADWELARTQQPLLPVPPLD